MLKMDKVGLQKMKFLFVKVITFTIIIIITFAIIIIITFITIIVTTVLGMMDILLLLSSIEVNDADNDDMVAILVTDALS